jgi:hypothetical protein
MRALIRIGVVIALAAWAAVGLDPDATRAAGRAGVEDSPHPRHVLIIRHAEKTGDKEDVHLSRRGRERADILDRLFTAGPDRPDPFPRPDVLIAASDHKDSHRPIETLSPLAKKLALTLDTRFDSKLPAPADQASAPKKLRLSDLRDELFGTPKYTGKTVLVAWRHSTIPALAAALKADKVPEKWDDAVFDRVWQIDYDKAGAATFRDRPERLLPGDSGK